MLKRSTPIKGTPLKKRFPKRKKGFDDPNFRGWVKEWPCLICFIRWCKGQEIAWFNAPVWMRLAVAELRELEDHPGPCAHVEFAHVGGRGLSQRCADKYGMPLGRWHHQHVTIPGGGPESHHTLGRKFFARHGIDRDAVLEILWKLYREETGGGEI
jgi:hypothetical protein